MGSYTSHPSEKKGLRSQVFVKLESLFCSSLEGSGKLKVCENPVGSSGCEADNHVD